MKSFLAIIFTLVFPAFLEAQVNLPEDIRVNNSSTTETLYSINRASYMPLIENTLNSYAPLCIETEDDEATFKKLKYISSSSKSMKEIIGNELEAELSSGNPSPGSIKKIAERSRGHISLSYPNETTIQSLLDIWKENPCSHGAALALVAVENLVALTPGRIQYGDLGRHTKDRLFILNNIAVSYPGAWEAEWADWKYYFFFNSGYEVLAEVAEPKLNYLESIKISKDKYYLYYDPERNFFRDMYKVIESYHNQQCFFKGTEEISKTGKISDVTIKHYKEMDKWRKRRMANAPYTEWSTLPRCYQLIKQYAPTAYFGDPTLVPRPSTSPAGQMPQ